MPDTLTAALVLGRVSASEEFTRVLPAAVLGRSPSDGVGRREKLRLFAGVTRLKLVPNGQDEDNVFGRKPTVLRDVSVTAA